MNNVELIEKKIIALNCREDGTNYSLVIKLDESCGVNKLPACHFVIPVRDCSPDFPKKAQSWKRITFLQYNGAYNILTLADDGNIGSAVILKRSIGLPGQSLWAARPTIVS